MKPRFFTQLSISKRQFVHEIYFTSQIVKENFYVIDLNLVTFIHNHPREIRTQIYTRLFNDKLAKIINIVTKMQRKLITLIYKTKLNYLRNLTLILTWFGR